MVHWQCQAHDWQHLTNLHGSSHYCPFPVTYTLSREEKERLSNASCRPCDMQYCHPSTGQMAENRKQKAENTVSKGLCILKFEHLMHTGHFGLRRCNQNTKTSLSVNL